MEWSSQLQAPRVLPPEKNPDSLWIGKRVGTKASMDWTDKKKNLLSGIQNPGCRARSLVTLPTTVYEFQVITLQTPMYSSYNFEKGTALNDWLSN